MIKQFRKMRIIEMVEWERNTCKDIGNVLIFMIGGMLIAYCLHVKQKNAKIIKIMRDIKIERFSTHI